MPALKQKKKFSKFVFFLKLREIKNVHRSNECTMLVTNWQIDYPVCLSTATLIWKIVSFFFSFDIPPVLLFSIDGFKAEYLYRDLTPNIHKLGILCLCVPVCVCVCVTVRVCVGGGVGRWVGGCGWMGVW